MKIHNANYSNLKAQLIIHALLTVEMNTLYFTFFLVGFNVKLCSLETMPIGFLIETKKKSKSKFCKTIQ